ncbi:hypothetical protein F5Y03DRAFT_373426 [Xylaria venustula]|nr:hypothetical protein F5Y03DRAFT_373426 [Xylaria venustula]
MAYVSSSEDEFPDLEVVIQKHKHKTADTDLIGDKVSMARQPSSPKATQMSFDETFGKTPASTARRRKLGQGQAVNHSLLKPWQGSEAKMGACKIDGTRQTSWSRTAKGDTGTASAGNLIDRLPVKTKRAENRTISGDTKFDNPPVEQKRTRRLISRQEKKALEVKVIEKEKASLTSSDESESDAESYSQDEQSDFIVEGDSESDDLSIPSPQPLQSTGGPRRMQRRVLSSSNKSSFTDPIQDDPTTSPKKRREKQITARELTTSKPKAASKKNLEDFFEKLKISYDESDSDKPAKGSIKTPMLDPITPRKKATAFPGEIPRIPVSPWKPEHKEFWDPEVNFAWIDKHSPPKKSAKKILDLAAPDNKEELKRRYGTSPEKKQAKKAFDAVKEDLARDFLAELDRVITDGKLEELTEATGGLRIVWSNTLQTTAGRAHWKCKTTTTTSKQPPISSKVSTGAAAPSGTTTTKTTSTQHYASIELATKVLANESDLLNTVAHEFCHLAVFLLHGKPKLAHGAEFKTYGQRVMRASSSSSSSSSSSTSTSRKAHELPPPLLLLKTPRDRGVEINVTTRHSYEIEYRFVWRCADCGGEVHRHSRSVDPTRQRCGRCKGGVLVQVKPVPRGGPTTTTRGGEAESDRSKNVGAGVPVGGGKGREEEVQKPEKRKKTAYQEFTSREMKALSVSHKGLSFKEKMAVVSARWGEHQKSTKLKTVAADEGAAAVNVRGLAAAVEVLAIDDDGSDESYVGAGGEKKGCI